MSDHVDSAATEASEPVEPKHDTRMIEAPPTTIGGILVRLGPGLILVGSIVGSGELIATPATAAKAGFSLLWLILIGTVIKVLVQVEFGRFAIVNGLPALWGMNDVPGPEAEFGAERGTSFRGNWLSWYWFAMFVMSLAQLGGIVGGVGQALAIALPITPTGQAYNLAVDERTRLNLEVHEARYLREHPAAGRVPLDDASLAAKENRVLLLGWQIDGLPADRRSAWSPGQPIHATLNTAAPTLGGTLPFAVAERERLRLFVGWLDTDRDGLLSPAEFAGLPAPLKEGLYDDRVWAGIITVVTAVLLVVGRYGFIESASLVLVASFTFMTIANLIMLQLNPTWAVTWKDLAEGFSFQLPKDQEGGTSALALAFATFGIIGVGANELIQYPSWCIEKGYARFTGPRDESPEWAERAKGWLNVMCWDAWLSLAVYTFATVAFYLIGAAVLGRLHLFPSGTDMIRTLSAMYEPVFGEWTQMLFFCGAFAVLYSTFFVATAGHARVGADAVQIFTRSEPDEDRNRFWTAVFGGSLPFVCYIFYVCYPNPTFLVQLGAAMQAIMLPMLAAAALYFRYYRNDDRLEPGRAWDVFLWISCFGMSVAGCATVYFSAKEIMGMFK